MSKYGKQHLKLKISKGLQIKQNIEEEKSKHDIEREIGNKFPTNFE